jgi:hypothetical protein
MQHSLLFQKVEILKNKCEAKKGDLWQLCELVTHLTINGELTLSEAEQHFYALCKKLEGARES